MVKLTIRVKTRPGKKKEFLISCLGHRSSQGLIDHLRKEKGCLKYNFQKDKDRKDEFIIESEWNSMGEFEAHFKSKYYSFLIGAIHILCEQKTAKIVNGNRIKEIDLIKKIQK